ncbi:hypothetical protein [Amycolatopsis tolypomycina]|uniref:hypothetical protein n=1 Tax=Amycolatopsis tolypomycina TaxID=208445 RepID=UPI00115FF11C|nr:hypothetical protein [Amycolatopsis tolypomycina]
MARFATASMAAGGHPGTQCPVSRTSASRAVRWVRIRRRRVRAARDNRTRHSVLENVGIAVEYGTTCTRFFFFAVDGCATTADVSIGANEIVVRNRGISLFCTIAFVVCNLRLDHGGAEALSSAVDCSFMTPWIG